MGSRGRIFSKSFRPWMGQEGQVLINAARAENCQKTSPAASQETAKSGQ